MEGVGDPVELDEAVCPVQVAVQRRVVPGQEVDRDRVSLAEIRESFTPPERLEGVRDEIVQADPGACVALLVAVDERRLLGRGIVQEQPGSEPCAGVETPSRTRSSSSGRVSRASNSSTARFVSAPSGVSTARGAGSFELGRFSSFMMYLFLLMGRARLSGLQGAFSG